MHHKTTVHTHEAEAVSARNFTKNESRGFLVNSVKFFRAIFHETLLGVCNCKEFFDATVINTVSVSLTKF